VVGFAYGATSFEAGEPERCCRVVTDALGFGVSDAALPGTFELGRRRLTVGPVGAYTAPSWPKRPAWLRTRADATGAFDFYRGHGWLELGLLPVGGGSRPYLVMTRRLRN
jgi:hypothetical protein